MFNYKRMHLNDYTKKAVRSAAVLTGSYVAGTVLDCQPFNQLILIVDFTIGSLTSAEIKVEFADNSAGSFYQVCFESISAGTNTVTLGEYKIAATGKYRIAIPIKDRWVKISAKGTNTVDGSSLAIDALLGTV